MENICVNCLKFFEGDSKQQICKKCEVETKIEKTSKKCERCGSEIPLDKIVCLDCWMEIKSIPKEKREGIKAHSDYWEELF